MPLDAYVKRLVEERPQQRELDEQRRCLRRRCAPRGARPLVGYVDPDRG